MRTMLRRGSTSEKEPLQFLRLAAVVLASVLFASGCTSSSTSSQPSSSTPPQAAATTGSEKTAESPSQDDASIKRQTADLKSYLKENFGGGYGQKPVSWYGSIKSVTFVTPDHLVLKTSLSRKDSSKLNSIVTALNFHDGTPSQVEIIGRDGVKLFQSP
jgi:hypothetical protein